MSQITLEIKGLDKLMDGLKKYPAIAIKHTDKAIAKALTLIQKEARDRTPIGDTGRLKGSWNINKKPLEGTLANIMQAKGTNRYYGYDVEHGREPFYISGKELEGWAKKKNLNPYAVANSIRKKGTKANPFFKRSVNAQADNVDKAFDEALEAIISEI
jgi:hypothetical protein